MKDKFFRKCESIIGAEHIDLTVDPPVLYPSSEKNIGKIIRFIHSENHSIQIAGGGTYPVPHGGTGAVKLSTKALSVISEINPGDYLMIAQAGVIVDDAADEAEKKGLFMPLDITSGDMATIGGAYMTGAVGPCMTGYGAFSNSVTGVKCINTQGEVVSFGGRTAKNVTGYDLTHFLSGTMGLYALAVELIIKVYPLPESRLMAEALFPPQSKPFEAVDAVISGFHNVKRFEFIADKGLGREITIAVGFEGMDSPVSKYLHSTCDMMHNAGAEKVRIKDYNKFKAKRRKVARHIAGPGLYTFSIPPSSSGLFLEKIKVVSPEIPVIAHPLIGRFHLFCSDRSRIEALSESSLAAGGKLPAGWDFIIKNGVAGLFTKPELSVARALKSKMDPSGIFNPNLGIMNDEKDR